jgi:hypothetical protein
VCDWNYKAIRKFDISGNGCSDSGEKGWGIDHMISCLCINNPGVDFELEGENSGIEIEEKTKYLGLREKE